MEFKEKFARKINGIYTNITTDGELWVSASSFRTAMKWHSPMFYITQKDSDGIVRENWAYEKPLNNGHTILVTGQNWLMNLNGVRDSFIKNRTYLRGDELERVRAFLAEAAIVWGELDAAGCMKQIVSASTEEPKPLVQKAPVQDTAINIRGFYEEEFGNIRTTIRDGEPWFMAVDVCNALEITNPAQTMTRIENDEKFLALISNDGGTRDACTNSYAYFVNEPGLYALVLGSRKPKAKAFKRWLTHEVIPALRKEGKYEIPNQPTNSIPAPRTIPVSPYFLDFDDATALLFEDANFDRPYLEDFEVRHGVSDLIKAIARRTGDPTRRDTWREFYQGAEEIGRAGLMSRDKGGKSYIDLIRHEEWWAFVVQVMDMASTAGVPVERYVDDDKLIERFVTLFQCYRMCLTLVEAREMLKLSTGSDLKVI